MDVERIVPNSTYDDCTKNSTQDHTSIQVHHNHDISSNFHDKKNKKLHKPLYEFDYDEDNDGIINLSRINVRAYGQMKGQFDFHNYFNPYWTQILFACTLRSHGFYAYCASYFKK
jgi:hypothetical protein